MIAALINAGLVLGIVLALVSASMILGPTSRLEGDGGLPYETGMPPLGSASHRNAISYVRFAVLFVVFDVDLAFLLPWVCARQRLDLAMMAALTVFLGLAALMLAYVWRKGALECR